MAGFSEMISIRTRWLDDQILEAVGVAQQNQNNNELGSSRKERAKQLIILGAGYDTRGFRLDLWKENNNNDDDNFVVLEVDQPDVQNKKLAKLQWLIQKDDKNGPSIANRIDSKKVQFVPVNFNTDDLQEKLQSTMEKGGFLPNQCSVITLEGVTQYIPKESTADTLKKLKGTIERGSTLLVTYVDRKLFAEEDAVSSSPSSSLSTASRRIMSMAARVGEPWISGWSKGEFKDFLMDCGYRVLSDTGAEDYNETYLKSIGRSLDDQDLFCMERFVVAEAI